MSDLRDLTPEEVASGINPEALIGDHDRYTAQAVRAWRKIRRDLIARITQDLTAIVSAAAGQYEVTLYQLLGDGTGAEAILPALQAGYAKAVSRAIAEARSQGVIIEAPLEIAQEAAADALAVRAASVENLMVRSLANYAVKQAVTYWSPAATGQEVAEAVQADMEQLSDSFVEEQMGGAVAQAVNDGRRAVMALGPAALYYASELLDQSTCTFCRSIDGTEYQELVGTVADYPTGGYVACRGGVRCRGTIVAVYQRESEATIS